MADTVTDICNQALANIGVSETIENITDDNPEAEACNLHYDSVLDKALAKFDWAFARRLFTLVTAAGTPPEPWTYQYDWPGVATMVKPLRIDDQLSSRQSTARIPYTSYTNGSGARILLCHIPDAKLWYTHRETNVAIWPEWFVDFMGWALAAKIAGPLSSDSKLQKDTKDRAILELSEAISRDAEEGQEDPEPEASWIAYRDSDVGLQPGIRADDYLP